MKIAVMGMGVAGSYLVSRLKNDHEVVGFERMDEIKHDSICAWIHQIYYDRSVQEIRN